MDLTTRKELVEVARGDRQPERVLLGGKIVNTLSREVHVGDILLYKGRIAAVLEPTKQEWGSEVDVVDVSGLFVSPGFIDPHVHVESSMITVTEYARAVIPRGTTTIAADPHEIGNVLGQAGMRLMVDEASTTDLRMLLRVPGRIPAMPEELETSNAKLTLADTRGMFNWPNAVCLAGDINPTLIITADEDQLAKVAMVQGLGLTVSGQAPGLLGRSLHAYAAGGPEDSHVAQNVDEIIADTRAGIRTILALRPGRGLDKSHFAQLAARIREDRLETRYLQFCTDDIHAHFLHDKGSLDHRIRTAIEAGFDTLVAYQMATLNVAEGLRIDRDFGSISPGRHADLIILRDLEKVIVDRVFVRGNLVATGNGMIKGKELPPGFKYPDFAKKTMKLKRSIECADLQIKINDTAQSSILVRAITMTYPKQEKQVQLSIESGVILPDPEQDILAFSVAERHKSSGRIGRGFINGFGLKRGALATSISHDAHNLLVLGANFDDMALAANRLAEIGGGYAVALNGEIIFDLPLPIAGLMSEQPLEEVANAMGRLESLLSDKLECADSRGILISLNFTCLPNIPFFGFTDHSLIDSCLLAPVDVVVGSK